MNVTGTKCIGNQLVRMFGEGANLKRVVTETVDGKTLTHVFDADGNSIVSRAKSFAKEAVGNKKVNTCTKVSLKGVNNYKSITDRVYSQDGKLLGSRETFCGNGEKWLSGKQSVNGNRFVKYFRANYTTWAKYLLQVPVGSRYGKYMNKGYLDRIFCNDKGLPMPRIKNIPRNDMTIAEMKDWMAVNKPGQDYLPVGFGPKSLNEVTLEPVLSSIKNKVAEYNEALKAFFL